MQGTRGAIRTGGDDGGAAAGEPADPAAARALFRPRHGRPDGTAEVAFDIPAFAGTVRVMAVAWSEGQGRPRHRRRDRARSGGGHRDAAALPAHRRPRQHAPRARQRRRHRPATTPSRCRPTARSAVGGERDPDPAARRQAAQRRRRCRSPPRAVGIGTVAVRITGPGNFALERSYTLAAKPATQMLTRRTVRPIARGESLTLSNDLFADLVPGTGAVALSVGPSTALDVRGAAEGARPLSVRLLRADHQPRAAAALRQRARQPRRISRSTRRSTSASATRSTGCWRARARTARSACGRAGGEDAWLDAYVTDFLTRARERGFAVPDVAFKLALDRLRNYVGNAPDPSKDGGARPRLCALRAGAQRRRAARRPALSRRHQARRPRDARSPRRRSPRRSACSATGPAPSASTAAALEAIPPPPTLELGRTDYGSIAARLRRPGDARRRRRRAASRPSSTRSQRIEAARGADALHLDAGERLAGARGPRARARTPPASSLDVGGETRQRRALPQRRARRTSADAAARSPTTARRRCRRWCRSPARR